jgi:hypothetical protein
VDARGNHDDILSLLCTDRLEKSIIFSQLLLKELESSSQVSPNPAIDWDASCYVAEGISTRWLRVPRSIRSPVAYSFFYSANCRAQYFHLLSQVEKLHNKGFFFDPNRDAEAPVLDVATAIRNACVRFFGSIPAEKNLSVNLGRAVCEQFSAISLSCAINLTAGTLELSREDGSTVLCMKIGLIASSVSSLPCGSYSVCAKAGENSEEGVPVSSEGIDGFSRIITLQNRSSHKFSITGAADVPKNQLTSNPHSIVTLSHRDAMILASLLPINKAVLVSADAVAELNVSVLQRAATYPTDGTFSYRWSASGAKGDGTTKRLMIGEHILAEPSLGETGRALTFCCGLTLEVWLESLVPQAGRIKNIIGSSLRVEDLTRLKKLWFVDEPGRFGGPLDALVEFGLGLQIHSLEDAKPGDFVQFWRKSTQLLAVLTARHGLT